MSRIAKAPVVVHDKVEVTVGAAELTVKGPLGTSGRRSAGVAVKRDGDKVTFAATDDSQESNALRHAAHGREHGPRRKRGFEKRLQPWAWHRAGPGQQILSLGFSHPIVHLLPDGVKAGRRRRRKS
jgi:large subunit ribosomal protein L6